MSGSHEKRNLIIAGLIIGVIAGFLVLAGNPGNMGFCIACFVRDTVGALGLHRAAPVQYIRPEIIGLILGAYVLSMIRGEHQSKGGSSPIIRFTLGFFVMIGALMFLGCPIRMILRLGGGDLNALFGIAGFAGGIGFGTIFLKTRLFFTTNLRVEQVRVCYDACHPSWAMLVLSSNCSGIYLL